MAEKYDLQHFGLCPRVYCNGAKVLPVGCSDTPGQETVKLFCPSCLDVYTPPNSRFQSVDGAFFGTTFGCLFFMTFPEFDVGVKGDHLSLPTPFNNGNATNDKSRSSSLASTYANPASDRPAEPVPTQPAMINGVAPSNLAPGLGPGKIHEPRIYGFRVSERSKTGPRMKWLRMRPTDVNELDESRRYHEIHGGDDEEIEGAIGGPPANGVEFAAARVAGRKKAPIRSRRRQVSGQGGEAMDTNGVGEGV